MNRRACRFQWGKCAVTSQYNYSEEQDHTTMHDHAQLTTVLLHVHPNYAFDMVQGLFVASIAEFTIAKVNGCCDGYKFAEHASMSIT